jgi:hypothetical protein
VRILFPSFIFGALLAVTLSAADAQKSPNALPPPTVRPAIDGAMAAFQNHPLVGMLNWEGADNHDLAQQEDFYAALVRDPRFAHDVGNVVVEFGASSAQGIIDRYVNGQDVPYTELRKVWTDTLGWVPPPIDLGYVNLFAQVRATNLTLPPAQRIHVWLSEPPVDWSKVKKPEDLAPPGMDVLQFRDNYVSDFIERQILDRRRKALVIYGGYHFVTDPILIGARPPGSASMAQQVEKRYPGAIFKISTYVGHFTNAACTAEFEKDKTKLAPPVLLTPIRGTTADDPSFLRRCVVARVKAPPNMPREKQAEYMDHEARSEAGLNTDAMLYLGPAASLTESPTMPDAYLDGAYLKEIMRRLRIIGLAKATPSDLGITVDKNPASPGPFKHF